MSATRMFLALCVISLVSGVALGGLYEATHELADNNILKFKKIPAVVAIHEAAGGSLSEADKATLETELLSGRKSLEAPAGAQSKEPLLVFPVKSGGQTSAVALEAFGQGFGGKLGVMAGFDLATDSLVGIGVTTMSETPGLGTRVKEPRFAKQFVGMAKGAVLKVKKDGGVVDAVSGATISSRAVAEALRRAREVYEANKVDIRAALAAPAGQAPGTQAPAP